jgi:hypothetical protein
MRSPRPSHLSLLAALAALAVALAAVSPATATPSAPLLWAGEIRNAAGQPSAAELVAYVRPPASRLSQGDALVPLARAKADSSGRFALRAAPNDAVRSYADPAGWVTVMVAAFSDDGGMTLAVDSVAWKPAGRTLSGDDAAGRWVTSPAELFAGPGYAATGSTPDQGERPDVLVLSTGDRRRPMESRPVGPDPGWCVGPHRTTDAGDSWVSVGELHMNNYWGGLFEYTNTKSTSFQIGASIDGGRWSTAGSVSMDDSSSFSQETTIGSAGHERLHTYKALMKFKRFTWRCARGEWHDAETIEPVDWTGDMDVPVGGSPPPCNSKFIINAMPTSETKRRGGSGTTLSGAISVGPFSGSVTSSTSEVVRQEWHNPLPHGRKLCGSTNYPKERTRVYSFA